MSIQKDADSFEQVSKLTESILGIMTEKETRKQYRQNTIIKVALIIITAVIIIAYLATK